MFQIFTVQINNKLMRSFKYELTKKGNRLRLHRGAERS